jgi:uncharacterized protein (UPF0333 family)
MLQGFKVNSEKGQVTLEILIVLPLFIGLLFLAMAVAAVWHGHNLSSAISLEGAAREAAQPGAGLSFVSSIGNNASNNVNWAVEIADYDYYYFHGKRFTVRGNVSIPWAPFGLNWSIPVQGSTYYPDWEFNGE